MTELPYRRVAVSPEVLFRELDGEAVLLDLNSERYFGLDDVGTRIWHLLAAGMDLEAICRTMLGEYQVEETQLCQDLNRLVSELLAAGLVTAEDEDPEEIP